MNLNTFRALKAQAYSLWVQTESLTEKIQINIGTYRLISFYTIIFAFFLGIAYTQFPEKYGAIVGLLCVSFFVIGATQEAYHHGGASGAMITFLICCALIGSVIGFFNSDLYNITMAEWSTVIYAKEALWLIFMYVCPIVICMFSLSIFAFTWKELSKGEIVCLGIIPTIILAVCLSGFMLEMYIILGSLVVIFGYGVIFHDTHITFVTEYVCKVTNNHNDR